MGSCERGLAQTPVFDVPVTVASSGGIPRLGQGSLGGSSDGGPGAWRWLPAPWLVAAPPAPAALLRRGSSESGVGGAASGRAVC